MVLYTINESNFKFSLREGQQGEDHFAIIYYIFNFILWFTSYIINERIMKILKLIT